MVKKQDLVLGEWYSFGSKESYAVHPLQYVRHIDSLSDSPEAQDASWFMRQNGSPLRLHATDFNEYLHPITDLERFKHNLPPASGGTNGS